MRVHVRPKMRMQSPLPVFLLGSVRAFLSMSHVEASVRFLLRGFALLLQRQLEFMLTPNNPSFAPPLLHRARRHDKAATLVLPRSDVRGEKVKARIHWRQRIHRRQFL